MLLSRDLKKTDLPTSAPSETKRTEPARDPRSEETRREAARMRRSRGSYPAHEYGRNDRFTDSSHRRLPLRSGFLKRKARAPRTPTGPGPRTECTSSRTSTVYALRLQPFRFLSFLPHPIYDSCAALFHSRRPVSLYPSLCSLFRILTFHLVVPFAFYV